jgi:hypothetical protein
MRLVDGVPVDAADRADVYELALSALPDTVFLATADGTLAWVCPNVSVTVGRSADAVVGEETVASLLGPELAPTAVLDGDEDLVANVDATVTGADGDPRDLLVTVRRLTDVAVETTTTAGLTDRRQTRGTTATTTATVTVPTPAPSPRSGRTRTGRSTSTPVAT